MDFSNPTPYTRDFPEESPTPSEVIRLRSGGHSLTRITLTLSPKGVDARAAGQWSLGHAWGELDEVVFLPAHLYQQEWQRSRVGGTLGTPADVGWILWSVVVSQSLYRGGSFIRLTTRRGVYFYGCDQPAEFRRGLALYRPDLLPAWDAHSAGSPLSGQSASSESPQQEWSVRTVSGWGWAPWAVLGLFVLVIASQPVLRGGESALGWGVALTVIAMAAWVLLSAMRTRYIIGQEGLTVRRFPLPGCFMAWGEVVSAEVCEGHDGWRGAGRGVHLSTRTRDEHIPCPHPESALEAMKKAMPAARVSEEGTTTQGQPPFTSHRWEGRPTLDGLKGPLLGLAVLWAVGVLLVLLFRWPVGPVPLIVIIVHVCVKLVLFLKTWHPTVLTVAEDGVYVQTAAGEVPDQVLWSSLTVARRAERTQGQAWGVILNVVLSRYSTGSDVGGPLVEVGSRWFTWKISCPEPEDFLAAVYRYRPDCEE